MVCQSQTNSRYSTTLSARAISLQAESLRWQPLKVQTRQPCKLDPASGRPILTIALDQLRALP